MNGASWTYLTVSYNPLKSDGKTCFQRFKSASVIIIVFRLHYQHHVSRAHIIFVRLFYLQRTVTATTITGSWLMAQNKFTTKMDEYEWINSKNKMTDSWAYGSFSFMKQIVGEGEHTIFGIQIYYEEREQRMSTVKIIINGKGNGTMMMSTDSSEYKKKKKKLTYIENGMCIMLQYLQKIHSFQNDLICAYCTPNILHAKYLITFVLNGIDLKFASEIDIF